MIFEKINSDIREKGRRGTGLRPIEKIKPAPSFLLSEAVIVPVNLSLEVLQEEVHKQLGENLGKKVLAFDFSNYTDKRLNTEVLKALEHMLGFFKTLKNKGYRLYFIGLSESLENVLNQSRGWSDIVPFSLMPDGYDPNAPED